MLKNILKAAAAALIMAVVLLSGPVRAEASDAYFGQLDPFTGDRVVTVDDEGEAVSGIVWLSDRMFFDTEMRMYGYPAERGTVYSNVADGMILRERVLITVPSGVSAELFMNGAQIEFTGQEIDAPGNYVLRVNENGTESNLFTFTITGRLTCSILSYTVPEGFRITDASRNGEEISYSRKYVDMSEEGEYSIYYECYLTGMSYSLSIIVDTTPPVIRLIGVEEDGRARGPVKIEGLGDGEALTVLKDGEPMSLLLTNTLTQSGRYEAIVADEAGNVSTYPFTIMIYLDRNGWVFILIFVLLIAAIVIYTQYQRTHLRIR